MRRRMPPDPLPPSVVFTLPPPSTSRFVLLALTLAAFALFTGSWVALRSGPNPLDPSCVRAVDVVACTDPAIVGRGLTVLGAPVLLAVLALLGYRLVPPWLIRRRRLVALPPGHRAGTALAGLPARVGLSHAPDWYRQRGDLSSGAWTLPGRVVLGGDLLSALSRGSGAATTAAAIVMHELSHLRNRDVGRTFLVLVGGAVAALAAAGLLVDALAYHGPVGFELATRTIAVAAVLLLTLLAVLRAREHDADLRVATIDPAGMAAALAAPEPQRAVPWWLRSHPTRQRRREVLNDPAQRLQLTSAECLTTGLATGLAGTELGPVLDRLLIPVGAGTTPAYLLTGLIIGLPVVAVVGLGSARAALGPQRPRRERLATGMSLGVGLILGTELAPRTAASWVVEFSSADDRDTQPSLLIAQPAAAIWLAVLAIGGCLLLLSWASAVGPAWVTAQRRDRPTPAEAPDAPIRPAVTSAALLLAALLVAAPLGYWLLAVRLAATGFPLPLLAAALTGPAGLVVFVLPVAVGLLVLGLLRRTTGRRPQLGRATLAGLAGLLVVIAPGLAVPAPTAGPAPPQSAHAGIACLWLIGQDVLTDPRDKPYLVEVGRYLAGTDQNELAELGEQLTHVAGQPAQSTVTIQLTRWCQTWLNQ